MTARHDDQGTPESSDLGRASRGDDQTHADSDQSHADSDQTHADKDQTRSDRDQGAADLDQEAADNDQAASDWDLGHGGDRAAHDSSREAREQTTQIRRETAGERYETATARDATAVERDLSALRSDRAAEARDLDDDERDAEVASLVSLGGTRRATSRRQLVMRSARDRQRAADDRTQSAAGRAEDGHDREHAASDRRLAAGDRAHAGAERDANAIDLLTGARRRGPGLAELQHQIDRARRGAGQLVVAYVDVDSLKETNDTKGHQAGDATLEHVVDVFREHLRSYEPIVRLGGDEFACAMSDTTIENVRSRLDKISVELADGAEDISISVGVAALMPGDTPMDLINRADTSLLRTRRKERPPGGPERR